MRSDVGAAVSMEVRVSNIRSTVNATLDIFYPAQAMETGGFFYLLPDCSVSVSIIVRTIPLPPVLPHCSVSASIVVRTIATTSYLTVSASIIVRTIATTSYLTAQSLPVL